ncbi:phage portal protein [Paracoccus chinensis]|uniref:Phage portal protein, lambda family n=1 Tax=Paracoccus chinensis TaxID=525640 RepID=A0A1G9H8K1_9RHOB|nr:phage portal protein [Paracoccus chinensis]SDL09212.1 phage portal protein, lambda family [Paracoccus chinensis]
MPVPFARTLSRIFKRSGIEAGANGRRWAGSPMLANPNSSILSARGPAHKRAAALHVNTPYGSRIVETWTSAIVGKGWQVRSQHPDAEVRRWIGDAFEGLILPILTPLARALVRDGEALVRLSLQTGPDQLRLSLLPCEQLDASLTREQPGAGRIVAGVEFDADDQIVAYHVLPEPPGTAYAPPHRLPARDVLHVFDPLFPGQVRGLSWLAPVLLKLRDRDEASDALLMQLKVASLMTGFVRDPDGGSAGFGDGADGAVNVSLEPGAMRILPPGAEVTFSQPGQGLTQAIDFLRAQDREIAAGVGVTFEQLTGDLGEANYSSARVGLLEFRRRVEMLQRLLIEGQFLRPLWRRWIEAQALAGTIPADQVEDYLPVRFVAPGWQWVDPRNEVEAEVAAINAGLKSREEVVAGRGRDIDDLDAERARDTQAKEATQ